MLNVVPLPKTIPYWDKVKDSPNDVRMNLIELLYSSLMSDIKEKADKENVIEKLAGAWSDDGMSADEFVEACTSGRNKRKEMVML